MGLGRDSRGCRVTAHPEPAVIATHLRRLAALLDDRGTAAINTAHLLADRGYPTNTAGGPRSSDTTSSTERAALNPHPWTNVDRNLHATLTQLWHNLGDTEGLLTRLLAHAPDDDPIPVGRGHCAACNTFCTGDGDNDRLRSKLCHPCNSALTRWRTNNPNSLYPDFIRHRRRHLGIENQPANA